MKIHLLTGFLGSGKTTAIQHASRILLQEGVRLGVITNDQGLKLVDGGFFKAIDIPSRQVVNGCFCCNYDNLDRSIQSIMEANKPHLIFAESVGSCTDIVATVLKPLLRFRPGTQPTVSTFADIRLLRMILADTGKSFDETVNYIYQKQLEEAGIIIVNKIDLSTTEELMDVKQLMQERYGDKILLYQNSFDEDSIRKWLSMLNEFPANKMKSLSIDYDIYAEGEAQLAWFDQEIEIYSSKHNPVVLAENLINKLYKRISDHQIPVGHLKFLVNGTVKISFTSGSEPFASLPNIADDSSATQVKNPANLLINLRVQTSPQQVVNIVSETISEVEIQYNCTVIVISLNAFQPGYPKPMHRFLANQV